MLERKININFPNNSHSDILSLLSICCVPFKFDESIKNDEEIYKNYIGKGIDISKKKISIKVELNKKDLINDAAGKIDYPQDSKIKNFVVVIRSFKYHNGQFYYC